MTHECPICGATGIDDNYVLNHCASHPPSEQIRRFGYLLPRECRGQITCPCNKVFSRKEDFIEHLRNEGGLKEHWAEKGFREEVDKYLNGVSKPVTAGELRRSLKRCKRSLNDFERALSALVSEGRVKQTTKGKGQKACRYSNSENDPREVLPDKREPSPASVSRPVEVADKKQAGDGDMAALEKVERLFGLLREGADAPRDLSGTTLDDFRLERRLGQGGMGEVYLAQQRSLKRKVAVKVMRRELMANETAVRRFRGEADAVARLSHANIVHIYAISDSRSAIPYIALEFVEGADLGSKLSRRGPAPVADALFILRRVAAAIQHASEHGIVHRDIKPANILLRTDGEVKVTDFGLARCLIDEQQTRLTQSGAILGTPMYMSPEQVQAKKLDVRSDIYSLGVTAYHMLAGKPPYQEADAFELAWQHVHGTPRPLAKIRPDLPQELCDIVDRMMAKNPADRFQSGKDLVNALAEVPDQPRGHSKRNTSQEKRAHRHPRALLEIDLSKHMEAAAAFHKEQAAAAGKEGLHIKAVKHEREAKEQQEKGGGLTVEQLEHAVLSRIAAVDADFLNGKWLPIAGILPSIRDLVPSDETEVLLSLSQRFEFLFQDRQPVSIRLKAVKASKWEYRGF